MEQEEIDFTLAMTLKNAEATLPRALDGIRNVDYDFSRLKFVFVDGGSKDSSVKMVNEFLTEYKHTKSVLLIGDYDVLQGRNLCIQKAEGKYLLFVDSDVIVPPNILKSVMRIFEEDSDVAFVNIPCLVDKRSQAWGQQDTLFQIRGEPQGMSCAAIRLSTLKEVGAFLKGIPQGENPIELSNRFKSSGYSTIVASFSATHLKSERRSFLGYAKASLLYMPFLHIQAIRSGDKRVLARYSYYTILILSLVLIMWSGYVPPLTLLLVGAVYHLYKSRCDPRGLALMLVGLALPFALLRALFILARKGTP